MKSQTVRAILRCSRLSSSGDASISARAGNADDRTKVDRRKFVKLRPRQACSPRMFKRGRLEQPAIQGVERIITGKVPGPAPFPKFLVCFLEINHFGVRRQSEATTLWLAF